MCLTERAVCGGAWVPFEDISGFHKSNADVISGSCRTTKFRNTNTLDQLCLFVHILGCVDIDDFFYSGIHETETKVDILYLKRN